MAKPFWAIDYGCDKYGIFADFAILLGSSSDSRVRQRMRWIPPGQFVMGSPENETGRSSDEIQHAVTISTGYWMFVTPVTQLLWSSIMPTNPSRFVGPERPVEQVNWEQANDFADELTKRIPSMRFALPTEAQWEYACRAGTSTAIYTGNLEILSESNAPALDPIAWYGGNSGHEFDLSEGHDITRYDWLKDKQYEFSRAATRKVASKLPNPWGLYDMLGNVWEWCSDWFGDYEVTQQVDPMGVDEGSGRVVRGGGWINGARSVRAAYRVRFAPGGSNGNLGFRLLSSAVGK